jgi:hypothetical protein
MRNRHERWSLARVAGRLLSPPAMSTARTVLVVAAVLAALAVIALVGGVVYVNRFSPVAPYLKGPRTSPLPALSNG